MLSKRETKKLVNDIKEQAIKDWFVYGDFDQWFWDRADDYELDEEDIKNINNILQKLIDKISAPNDYELEEEDNNILRKLVDKISTL